MKNEKMYMTFGDNRFVVEKCCESGPHPPMICVYLEDKSGNFIQDVCCIQATYHYDGDSKSFKASETEFDMYVWGNENDESWTEDFVIGIADREE